MAPCHEPHRKYHNVVEDPSFRRGRFSRLHTRSFCFGGPYSHPQYFVNLLPSDFEITHGDFPLTLSGP